MRHLHLAVINNGHFLHLVKVPGELALNILDKAAVNLLYNLVNPRQQAGENLNRPFLQCLGHNRMVGIGAGVGRDFPCLIPVHAFLIQEDAHQLCHGNGWMGIIELDGHFVRQLVQILMVFLVTGDSALHTGRYEEILLF